MKKLLLLILFLIPTTFTLEAQFLTDPSSKETTLAGLNFLYNGDYTNAQQKFAIVKEKYGNHPLSSLLDAIFYQYKYFPIEDNPAYHAKYFQYLQECNDKAEILAKKDDNGPESTFFLLSSAGYTAQYYNDKGEIMKAGLRGKEAYNYLLKGFDYMQKNPEFYFTSGLYNYYRVQYPESKPLIKPIMSFFKAGNKALGISQMKKATQLAIFSKIEATYYLMDILIKYEGNYKEAMQYASTLRSKYPKNINFKVRYIECLLYNKQYESAETLINTLANQSNNFLKVAYYTFKGLTLQQKDDAQAQSFFANALKIKSKNEQIKEYHSICYLEMAKAFKEKGDLKNAKIFYNQAMNLTEYEWVKSECRKALAGM